MKTLIKRTIAAITAASVMVPLAACHKTEDGNGESGAGEGLVSGAQISSDTPWYDLNTIEIPSVDNPDDFQYSNSEFVGLFSDKYVFYTQGILQYPDGVDDSNFSDEYAYDRIDVYGENGAKLSSVNLREMVNSANLGEHSNIDSVVKMGDNVLVNITSYTNDYETAANYEITVDVNSGTAGDITESSNPYVAELNDIGAGAEAAFTINGYMIQPYWVVDTTASYILLITDSSRNITKVDLRDYMPTVSLWSIRGAMDLGDNKVVIYGNGENGDVYIDFDFNSMTPSVSGQDYSWLSDKESRLRTVEGVGTVIVDGTSISKIDLNTSTTEEIFNYAYTNANRAEVEYLTPVYVSEEKVVLTGETTTLNTETLNFETSPVIKIFNKAQTNPNSGKTYLTLTSLNGYSLGLCDAVCQFNDNSTEYFIVFDPRYELDKYVDYSGALSSEDYDKAFDNGLIELGNQLSIDVMSGDGPDILIGSANTMGQLNNPDYLVDLNDYVQSNLTEDKYMRNVIDACYIGGSIFQLPFNFKVKGIVTGRSNVGEGKNGFTFDEYGTFVNQVCNGADPIANNKMEFFITSMSSMMDLMQDENGNLNFDNDAFRALAEYTSNNVLDINDDSDMADSASDNGAFDITVFGPDEYYNNISEDTVLLGLPSYDGRGPAVDIGLSVAVSAQSASVDGCMQFVDYLVSPQTQILFCREAGTPINRESIDALCNICIERHNEEIRDLQRNYSDAELRSWGYNTEMMDASSVAPFMELVNSVDGKDLSYDGAIYMIIREEMPAYFEGQKSIDEVITVIQDRAQTVVSERS